MNIKTDRLSLKLFSAKDADETYACITPTLTRFMAWEPATNRTEFDQIWQSWLPVIQVGADIIYVIRLNSNQLFLGLVGIHNAHTATPELGIWIREDHHGYAYGREAVTATARWASSNLKPRYFIYPVAEKNHASRKIAESLGGIEFQRAVGDKYNSIIYHIPTI